MEEEVDDDEDDEVDDSRLNDFITVFGGLRRPWK